MSVRLISLREARTRPCAHSHDLTNMWHCNFQALQFAYPHARAAPGVGSQCVAHKLFTAAQGFLVRRLPPPGALAQSRQ